MTTQTDPAPAASGKSRAARAVSIDLWAVALALGVAALVYAGVIKHVPW